MTTTIAPAFSTSYSPIASSTSVTTASEQMFFGPDFAAWKSLRQDISESAEETEEQKPLARARAARETLKAFLLSSLQMQHVVVLAGSGTSLGPVTKGPSMWQLWNSCVRPDAGASGDERALSPAAAKLIETIKYNVATEGENIEALLSRCDAFLQINNDVEVASFVTLSKKIILDQCSDFLNPADTKQLAAHCTFLHRLSRRRVRDSRLKLFTTNYDLCFETAAGRQGLVALDGFSFTQPRQFDPRFFLYDIVRRPSTGDDVGTPLEGVFHVYKLHGSVNWSRVGPAEIEVVPRPTPESACLIYPAKGKYQQSYVQPHLELVSQYLSALREPNTCLIVTGFGFNDDHLSEPILAAVRTNPHLRVIIVNSQAKALTEAPGEDATYWKTLFSYTKQGEDVWMINATFAEFAEMIPDLKSLTPAQRLTRDIKDIAGAK